MEKTLNGIKNIFSNKKKKSNNRDKNAKAPMFSFSDDTFTFKHSKFIPIRIKLPPVFGSVNHILDRKVTSVYLPLTIISLCILIYSKKNIDILKNINNDLESQLIYILGYIIATIVYLYKDKIKIFG